MISMFLSLDPFFTKNKVFKYFPIFFSNYANILSIAINRKFRLAPLCQVFADPVTHYSMRLALGQKSLAYETETSAEHTLD